MEINKTYRPWLLAGGYEFRPILDHVLIERVSPDSGRIIAADGFFLGVFPVDLDAEDETGLIRAELLSYAFRHSPMVERRWPERYRLRIEEDAVMMADGSRHVRQQTGLTTPYPDWRRIVRRRAEMHGTEPPSRPFAVDTHRIRVAAVALGLIGPAPMLLRTAGARDSILLRRVEDTKGDWELWDWQAPVPYVLLMPCARGNDMQGGLG